MQISGADYGLAVPSGVSLVCRGIERSRARDDHHPRTRRRAAIRAAHGQIAPVFRDSPQYVHEGLSRRLGVPVIVKVETVNPIRSFKGRGTWVAVAALAGEGRIGPDRADRVRVGRQLRPGHRLRRPRPRHPGRRVRVAQRQSGQGPADARPRRRGRSRSGRTSTPPGPPPRRTPPSTRSSCSSTATTRGSRPAPRPWRSS